MNLPELDDSEAGRLTALRRYEILDTPPDGNFDGITSLAAKLLKVPIALTTLVDTDRIWFKSRHGVEMDQIGRDPGLCASAILQGVPYVVEDARFDPRTLANPLVAGEFGLRFYAAVPLRTHDGYHLGTLCVLDTEPRVLGDLDMEILETLAGLVMDQMELRLASRRIAEKNAELAELNEEKDRFLAMASHDLRNPLGTVMLYGKLLEEQQVGGLNLDQLGMVATMCEASELMLQLVNDYLEYSAVDRSRIRLNRVPVELNAMVEGLLKFHDLQAAQKSISLKFESADELIHLEIDPERIRQALSNLIVNAIKFSTSHTVVFIRVWRGESTATIEVQDEGPGISEEERPCLFKPFSRTRSQSTNNEKSTGLGLSIVKRLVDAHGGNTGVSSEPGIGSTFFIVLPL